MTAVGIPAIDHQRFIVDVTISRSRSDPTVTTPGSDRNTIRRGDVSTAGRPHGHALHNGTTVPVSRALDATRKSKRRSGSQSGSDKIRYLGPGLRRGIPSCFVPVEFVDLTPC